MNQKNQNNGNFPSRLPSPTFNNKDKNLIFRRKSYGINFKLFKFYSRFFRENKFYKEINNLVFDYPTYISEESFENFVNACQNQEFFITKENACEIKYLSEKFGVDSLTQEIEKFIKKNESTMIIELFKDRLNQYNELIANDQYKLAELMDFNNEQKIIGESLILFIKNPEYMSFLCSLPINIIYNIITHYNNRDVNKNFNNDDNNNNDNNNNINNNNDIENNDEKALINFLFSVLEKKGSQASLLFSLIDFGKMQLKVLHRIRDFENRTKVKFEYIYLNTTLPNLIVDLIDENRQIKENAQKQIMELSNQILSLKQEYDKIHYHDPAAIVQDLTHLKLSRNKADIPSDFQYIPENQSSDYFRSVLDTVLIGMNEEQFYNLPEKFQAGVFHELTRLALQGRLDHDKLYFIITQLCRKESEKIRRDELLFMLTQKGYTNSNKFTRLKQEAIYATIPAEVTTVKPEMFSEFPKIKKIFIHDKVSFLLDIRDSVQNLKEIIVCYSLNLKAILSGILTMKKKGKTIKLKIVFPPNTSRISDIFAELPNEYRELVTEFILPHSVTIIESGAFAQCINLETINLPPELKIIPDRCFTKCERLKKVVFPDQAKIEDIEERAFYRCTLLKSIELPPSIKSIKKGAFECSGLETIELPPKLNRVEEFTFSSCENLTIVRLNENLRNIDNNAFEDSNNLETIDATACPKIELGRLILPKKIRIKRKE
ncbi:hypothetical protein M9Y10_022488 [Tritrichomonas musculus]|uniref:Leucine rich repeat protein n=1 Tax=Tritrichomonas musculus TaxID=1915356 RepID=A0ABR2KSR8_9EUKA